MKIRIDTEGGTEEVELSLNLEDLTMRESVRLEEQLGEVTFEALMAGKLNEAAMMKPRYIRAFLYAKLKTARPDLEIDGFDVDLDDVLTELGAEPEAAPKVEAE